MHLFTILGRVQSAIVAIQRLMATVCPIFIRIRTEDRH